jgi:hypothetical protein
MPRLRAPGFEKLNGMVAVGWMLVVATIGLIGGYGCGIYGLNILDQVVADDPILSAKRCGH